jgi:hypothetical protein
MPKGRNKLGDSRYETQLSIPVVIHRKDTPAENGDLTIELRLRLGGGQEIVAASIVSFEAQEYAGVTEERQLEELERTIVQALSERIHTADAAPDR